MTPEAAVMAELGWEREPSKVPRTFVGKVIAIIAAYQAINAPRTRAPRKTTTS